jgi:hypothetical protein
MQYGASASGIEMESLVEGDLLDTFVESTRTSADDQTRVEMAAWVLEHAISGISVDHYPLHGRGYHLLRVQSLQLARPAILALVALRVLCGGGVVSMALKSACCLMFPRVCFLTFVLSLCPRVVSMALTVVVLSNVAATHATEVAFASVGVERTHFRRPHPVPFGILAIAIVFTNVCALVWPASVMLDAILDVMYAAFLFWLPEIWQHLKTVTHIAQRAGPVLAFYVGTIFVFAWGFTVVLDDTEPGTNAGFETILSSAYTLFVASTGGNLPDMMAPSYAAVPFVVVPFGAYLFLTMIVFLQVVVAVVYDTYADQMKTDEVAYLMHQARSTKRVFALLADGMPPRIPKARFVALLEEFQGWSLHRYAMRVLSRQLPSFFSERLPAVFAADFADAIFAQLDGDGDGAYLGADEFHDICELLSFRIFTTPRHSLVVRIWPRLAEVQAYRSFCEFVRSGAQNAIVTAILLLNMAFLVVQSIYDLNNWPQPPALNTTDNIFTIAYVLDIVVKLLVDSTGTVFAKFSNRFDLYTTVLLLAAELMSTNFAAYANVFRILRLLRVVRVFKVGEVQKVTQTVWCMISASHDLLLFTFSVIALWGSVGVLLFAGTAKSDDPLLELWNFDTLPSALFTLVILTLTGWNDAIYGAYYDHAWGSWVPLAFFISYYVASVLVAFNVFVAFAIDAFKSAGDADAFELIRETDGLRRLRTELERGGKVVHFQPTAQLAHTLIMKQVFQGP